MLKQVKLKLKVKLPYNGHLLVADNFCRKGWNPGQTLIKTPLLGGYIIADTSLQWSLFSYPKWPFPL